MFADVLEGRVAHGLTADTAGTSLLGDGASLKGVLREGSLQEKPGPSIATEFGVLLPGVVLPGCWLLDPGLVLLSCREGVWPVRDGVSSVLLRALGFPGVAGVAGVPVPGLGCAGCVPLGVVLAPPGCVPVPPG